MKTIWIFLLLSLPWIPRILTIIAALLGALAAGTSWWIIIMIGIILVVLTWKWPWIGVLLCIGASTAYIIDNHEDPNLFIPGILFLIGILFLFVWLLRKQIKIAQEAYWEES
jgi:hypothetical protein